MGGSNNSGAEKVTMEAEDESFVSKGAFLKIKQCCGEGKEEPTEDQLVLKYKN